MAYDIWFERSNGDKDSATCSTMKRAIVFFNTWVSIASVPRNPLIYIFISHGYRDKRTIILEWRRR